jgi:hypothetical protein
VNCTATGGFFADWDSTFFFRNCFFQYTGNFIRHDSGVSIVSIWNCQFVNGDPPANNGTPNFDNLKNYIGFREITVKYMGNCSRFYVLTDPFTKDHEVAQPTGFLTNAWCSSFDSTLENKHYQPGNEDHLHVSNTGGDNVCCSIMSWHDSHALLLKSSVQ